MDVVYEGDRQVPVTVLRYKKIKVSQVKTKDKDSYEALQVCFGRNKRHTNKAEKTHFKKAGLKEVNSFVKELRLKEAKNFKPGDEISLEAFNKNDLVKVTSTSKGKGFSGVVKRWNFGGGPLSHGSRFHRRVGSIGNCTFPARVMKGRKMPGQDGFKTVSKQTSVIAVVPDKALIVKGPVAGAKNTLVKVARV